jgi:hypothetical protein
MRLVIFFLFLSDAICVTYSVCASGCDFSDLQAAINKARPGDTLSLRAGETFRGSFFLPWKQGDGYIVIQSSRADELPPVGYRVTARHAPLMAKLQQGHRALPVLSTGSSFYQIRTVDAATGTLTINGRNSFPNGRPVTCASELLPEPLQSERIYYVRDATEYTMRLAETQSGEALTFRSPMSKPMTCVDAITGHHYRIRGLELASFDGNQPSEYTLVVLGTGAEGVRSAVPHHIELIQVYIHGRSSRQTPFDGPRNCLALNGAHLTLRDSYLAECKREGEESKAIYAVQAPGPLEIRNNYLEAASVNILFGGGRPTISDHIIGDGDGTGNNGGVRIEGNHFYKQTYWKFSSGPGHPDVPAEQCQGESYFLNTSSNQVYRCVGNQWEPMRCAEGEYFRRTDVGPSCAAGACWVCSEKEHVFRQVDAPFRSAGYVVKQHFEAKSVRNAEIRGNVFENSWGASLAPAMQIANEGEYWVRPQNVVVENNIIHNVAGGMHTASSSDPRFKGRVRSVHIRNNLFYDYGETATPSFRYINIWPVMFSNDCIDCSLDHNTVVSGSPGGAGIHLIGPRPFQRLRITNNILYANRYGIIGDGRGHDCAALDFFVPDGMVSNNILVNNTGLLENGDLPCAKKTMYVPAKTELFVGKKNYRLSPSSPFSANCQRGCRFSATDGADLGADIDAVEAATSGAVAGTPSWAEQAELRATPSRTTAMVSFIAPADAGACSVKVFSNAGRTGMHSETTRQVEPGKRQEFELGSTISLKRQTDYWYLWSCGERKVPGRFRTE